LGVLFFFNFKFNKKEIENIFNENKRILENIKKDHLILIDSRFDSYEKETRNFLLNEQSELEKSYKELIKTYNDNLTKQIESQKELFDGKIKIIDEKFNDSKEIQKSDKIRLLKEIGMKTNRVEMLLLNVEAKVWEQKGVYGNSLTCYLNEAFLSIKIDYSWNLQYVLPNIIEMLKKLKTITKFESEQLIELTDKIPDEFTKMKNEILNNFKDKPIE